MYRIISSTNHALTTRPRGRFFDHVLERTKNSFKRLYSMLKKLNPKYITFQFLGLKMEWFTCS